MKLVEVDAECKDEVWLGETEVDESCTGQSSELLTTFKSPGVELITNPMVSLANVGIVTTGKFPFRGWTDAAIPSWKFSVNRLF